MLVFSRVRCFRRCFSKCVRELKEHPTLLNDLGEESQWLQFESSLDLLREIDPTVTARAAAMLFIAAHQDRASMVKFDLLRGRTTFHFEPDLDEEHEIVIPPVPVFVQMTADVLRAARIDSRAHGSIPFPRGGNAVPLRVRYSNTQPWAIQIHMSGLPEGQ